jgi:hypothetical protein
MHQQVNDYSRKAQVIRNSLDAKTAEMQQKCHSVQEHLNRQAMEAIMNILAGQSTEGEQQCQQQSV